jgi:hypothetical protein
MNLRPRHYVLIAVIFAVFVFNLIRRRSVRPSVSEPAVAVHTAPPAQTPAWAAFDHAAALRDAPDAQYQPALQTLQMQIKTAPVEQDMEGCMTWLAFYRQGALHPSSDPEWKQRSQRHLDGCVKFHLDTSV